ncbi:TolC family protein [Vibrio sp. RC27]
MGKLNKQVYVCTFIACNILILFWGNNAHANTRVDSSMANDQSNVLNVSDSFKNKINMNNLQTSQGYPVGFDDVFEYALDVSKEYHALTREVESKEILKDKEERYYYPDITFSSETTEYWGGPSPDQEETQNFIITLEAKLYGSGVKDRIAASEMTLEAGNIGLVAHEISIYYTVLKYLTKIELTREYEAFAQELRKDIEVYYLKQVNSTNVGVSTQSDAMQARLAVAEFDDTVYSVVSNVEQYFNKLVEETGIDIDFSDPITQGKVGLDFASLEPLLVDEEKTVTSDELLANNAELLQTQKALKSSFYNARSTRELVKVEVTSENYLQTNGDSKTQAFGDTDESSIQLNVELDIFNYGLKADQDSAYKMYEAEKFRFDMQFQQVMDNFRTSVTTYNQQRIQRDKTVEQIDILAELIENQKEEIFTDQVTYKDIVESISKLNKAKQTLLNIDLMLFDTLYELETLKSNKIL